MVRVVLPLRGGKRRLASVERTNRHITATARRPPRHAPPRLLVSHMKIGVRQHEGWPLYDLAPEATPSCHLIYLHGGAYISEITRSHWWLAAAVVRKVPCRVVLPIYPLGARAGAEQVVATVGRIAAQLIAEAGGKRVVLAGDSAGGGIALAVALALRDQGLAPSRIILISPWLDAAVRQPEQAALERRDAMLGLAGLRQAGRTYACGLSLDDPRVSPICGDLSRLAPITVFTGTRDLLNPDSHRLSRRCAEVGTSCELIEAPGMPHVYPLMPTPEGRLARQRLVKLLRDA
jgi:acetyl esterase/lipase